MDLKIIGMKRKAFKAIKFTLALLLTLEFWGGHTLRPLLAQEAPQAKSLISDAFKPDWKAPLPVYSKQLTDNGGATASVVEVIGEERKPLPVMPSFQQLADAKILNTSIVLMGKGELDESERIELGEFLNSYATNGGARNFANLAKLERLLLARPESPIRGSLQSERAVIARLHGHLLKQKESLEAAWEACKTADSFAERVLADNILSELLNVLKRLGFKEQLRKLLTETSKREVGGLAREALWRGRETLWHLDHKAEQNIFCGFTAANTICVPLGQRPIFPDVDDEKEQASFIKSGLSLYQLREFSRAAGNDLQIIKAKKGIELAQVAVPVPSVMHWKIGHYSALTEERDGGYRISDSHLALDALMPASVLADQASGYFLIPGKQAAPEGFETVGDEEAKTVFGRHCIHARDDEGCNPSDRCGSDDAMASYYFGLFNPSLFISDTPVRYRMNNGGSNSISLHYNERSTKIDDNPNVGNFGPRWAFNLLSYVDVISGGTTAASIMQLMRVDGEGSLFRYSRVSGTAKFISRYGDLPTLTLATYLVGSVTHFRFECTYSDGAKSVYSQEQGSTRFYLASSTNAQGRTTNLVYTGAKLTSVIDPEGRTTSFGYIADPGDGDSTTNGYRIRSIEDPYHRKTRFVYKGSRAQLWKIIDPMGIVSEFTYNSSDFVTSLKTPYGVTSFTSDDTIPGYDPDNYTDRPNGRILKATDPLGDVECIEQNDNTGFPQDGVDPNSPSSETMTLTVAGQVVQVLPKIDNLFWRNTFRWDKAAWKAGPRDYSKATIYNWLAIADTITGTLGSIKQPLEGRVWFNYPGQVTNHAPGVINSVAKTLRAVENENGIPTWSVDQKFYSIQSGTGPLVEDANSFHPFGSITGTIDAEGRQIRFLYSADGCDITNAQVRESGVWKDVQIFSDHVNHLPQKMTDAGGTVTTYTYTGDGQIATLTLSKGGNSEMTEYVYSSNRVWKVMCTDPANSAAQVKLAQFTYDSSNRIRTSTDEAGYVITYDYDLFDRVTLITYPDTTTEQFNYIRLDLDAYKDRGGLWTRYAYTPLQQLMAVQDPQGRVTQYQWCRCGSLSKLIDPMMKITTWGRDVQGRPTEKILPDGVTKSTYAYQKLSGRAASITLPNDQGLGQPTVSYSYSLTGQLRKQDYSNPNTPDVSYTYDTSISRLSGMLDGQGATLYTYMPLDGLSDGAGKVWKVDGPLADDTLRYGYDWRSELQKREIVSDAGVVSWSEATEKDSLGRLMSVVNGLGAFQFVYDPGNLSLRVDRVNAPNGLVSDYQYYSNDALNGQAHRLQKITHTLGGNTISSYSYGYDNSVRINSWARKIGATPETTYGFEYDRSSKLTTAVLKDSFGQVIPGDGEKFHFDGSGNRIVAAKGASTTGSQFNVLNQLTQVGGAGTTLVEGTVDEETVAIVNGKTQAAVTVNGQVATIGSIPGSNLWHYEKEIPVKIGSNEVQVTARDRQGNESNQRYQFIVSEPTCAPTYDANGNLLSDDKRTFVWDAACRLSGCTMNGDTYTWEYDGHNRRVTEKKNGVLIKRWIWEGLRMAQERNESNEVTFNYYASGERNISTGVNLYYAKDHLGSIRTALDGSGAVRAEYAYSLYGELTKLSGDLDSHFTFTGHFADMATDLLMAPYRVYNPEIGRWLSRDPIEEEGGLNLYAYVGNDPLNYIDPLGLEENLVLYNPNNPKEVGRIPVAKAAPSSPDKFTSAGEGTLRGPKDDKGNVLTPQQFVDRAKVAGWDGKQPLEMKQCLSGYAPSGQKSFAEQVHDLAGVPVTGVNGYHQYSHHDNPFTGTPWGVKDNIISSAPGGPTVPNPSKVTFK